MPPRKPQQPNDPDSETSIDEFLPLIPDAAQHTYLTYEGLFNKDEMNDLAQSVTSLLIEGAIRSFEGLAEKKTWLQRVTDHHALRLFGKRKKTVSLEKSSPDDFPYQQGQEKEVFTKELEDLLDELAGELPPRLRELLDLLRQEVYDTEEIAKRMGIKPNSVSKLKRRLFDVAREFLKSKGWK